MVSRLLFVAHMEPSARDQFQETVQKKRDHFLETFRQNYKCVQNLQCHLLKLPSNIICQTLKVISGTNFKNVLVEDWKITLLGSPI